MYAIVCDPQYTGAVVLYSKVVVKINNGVICLIIKHDKASERHFPTLKHRQHFHSFAKCEPTAADFTKNVTCVSS